MNPEVEGSLESFPKAFQRPGLDLPYYLFILPMLKLGVFHGKNRL